MAERFEIVPRNDDTPVAKEEKPNMLSVLEMVAGTFGQVIANFISGVGQVIAGVALGTAKFVGHMVDAAKELAGGIAHAIKGEGASANVISGAVDEKLGPLNNAITENTEHFQGLSNDVQVSIAKQKEIQTLSEENAEAIRVNREAAETAIQQRVSAENTLRNEIASALRKAESAQTSADGKSTIYYGSTTPKSPKNGDTWFKQVSGGSQILVYEGGKWSQKVDWAKVDADLAANKQAVDQAARDVADAQAKVKKLVDVELPAIKDGTAEFNQKLKDETEARTTALTSLQTSLDTAKTGLDTSMQQLETRLKNADTQLQNTLNTKISDDLAKAKTDLNTSMGQLETRLKEADKKLEERVGTAASNQLELAKRDLGVSMTQLETRLKEADKKLEERVGTAASNQLELAKQDLNRSLTDANKALATAREDLDTLSVSRPGNIFPDPHFQDPCWKITNTLGSNTNNGGELRITGQGKQTGLYYQPKGNRDKSIMLEKGGKYLLTATVYRSATFPDGRTVSVHMRQPGAYVGRPGVLPTGPVGVSVESAILHIPDSIAGGGSTLGFFLESNVPEGSVSIWDVQIVRAADNAMIIDGAITAAKVQAGAIETSKLAADAVTAEKIKAGQVVADKLAANSVAATNLQADSVTANAIKADQILSKHIKANQVTATEIASNTITALQIAAGTITANELAADSVTAKQIKSDQILSKHIKANQVTATEIASNTITALQIAAGTITANELAADSVTAKQIKSDAVTADKIKTNSVFAEHLVVGGPANLIANGSFTEGKEPWAKELSVRTIGASQALPPGDRYAITVAGQGGLEAHTGNQWFTVTPEALYAFEIWLYADKPGSRFFIDLRDQYGNHAGKSKPEVVGEGDISSSSNAVHLVSNVEVKTGWNKYSTVYQIGKNVTRARLGTFYFNHSNGAERNAIIGFAGISFRPMTSADLIVQGAVVADKIAANAVTAKAIASDQILAKHIKSNQITTNELAAKAVTADNLAAGAVTAEKISANQITGKHVLANSITANELQIRPGNMFPDPDFQDPCWGTSGQVYAHKNNGGELRFFPNGKQNGRYYQPAGFADRSFMLEEGAQYRFTATTWASTKELAKATIDIYTRYVKPDGSIGVELVGRLPVGSSATSTPSCIITMPANMKDGICTLGLFINPPWNGGQISVWNVQMVRAADASLIVDGAILAQHIKAGEITSNEIAANTITGANLKADTITGREVKAGTINANQLKVDNGFVKNAMIADATIEASKIKELDAGKITTGVMDGKHVKADTITVKQLRANSIIPIGGSLIHHEPPQADPTKPPEPIWWRVCDSELSATYSGWPRPEGNPWRMSSGAASVSESPYIPKRLVKVKPGQRYKLKLWLRATKPGSKLFIELRDQNGSLAKVYGGPYTGNNAAKYANDAENKWDVADFDKDTKGNPIPPEKAALRNYLVDNYTVHTYPTLVTATVWFEPHVEYVYLNRFYFNHTNGKDSSGNVVTCNQWIAGLSLELDIPDQAQVDKIQTDAIKALEDGDRLSRDFRAEQIKTNELHQAQVWQNRNMIELVDIRTPRLFGWEVSKVRAQKVCPWLPESWGSYPRPYMESPYFEMYQAGYAVFIGFKGETTGMFSIAINWDSGVIDRWAKPIEINGMRVHKFAGGASHIKIRSIEVTVFIESLRRQATVSTISAVDENKLIREYTRDYVVFKNGVTCNIGVLVDEGGKKSRIAAGKTIWGGKVLLDDECMYEFQEVANVTTEYSVPNGAAQANPGDVIATVA